MRTKITDKIVLRFMLPSLLLALSGCQTDTVTQPEVVEVQSKIVQSRPVVIPDVSPGSVEALHHFFSEMDYSWQHLEEGVPPFILSTFPQDLDNETKISVKKKSFFMALLPMVLIANQEILQERQTYQALLKTNRENNGLSDEENSTLLDLSKRYGLRGDPLHDHRIRTRILKRIDALPPSLVLAQAANESAWGSSRFAREGNNLFGEWTFSPGTGIVPKDRPPGATYEVRKFSSLFESVRSYMLNLNTNGAYMQLREARAKIRAQQKPVTGKALAIGLTRYSIRGEAYVEEIGNMIRQNKLERVDLALLRQPATEIIATPLIAGSGLFSSHRQASLHLSEAWQNPQL